MARRRCALDRPAGQRHRPIRARSSIQASRRGGRTKTTGSKPTDQNGLPVCVLPNEAPVPDAPEPTPGIGQRLQQAVSCLEKSSCAMRAPTGVGAGGDLRERLWPGLWRPHLYLRDRQESLLDAIEASPVVVLSAAATVVSWASGVWIDGSSGSVRLIRSASSWSRSTSAGRSGESALWMWVSCLPRVSAT
jgi:hypothetical protein